MEIVISNAIRVHPMEINHYDGLTDEATKNVIAALTQGYGDKQAFFVDNLARGLARITAAVYPRPVIVRMSDFKT
ncbi:hypothetical protein ACCS75_36385, partial [Rhizobium ruizarguesonis]